ncbi:ATP-binding cassette domain-containing protein [Antrihabitans cavernicola]|uniref:ATP-binding cassette domain-containing protein n=1 Tax=Antrihabitans cavernicola TaxID=2495913 RepID=A0A5A7S3Y2_9NOCA|nr:ATP-binding cassette domain-containing protein [Spelaeibacter cavernicola]
MPTELVRCTGVARTYGRGDAAVVAIHGLTATVRTGELIAVTGPSGSGKSTVLHLFAGLDSPTAGTITWPGLGGDPTGRPGAVGFVFQGPSLLAPLTAVENVALPMLLAGVTPAEAAARAATALGLVDAAALSQRLPEELSGGQAQRVAVARVLAARPALILADEPTGQLDATHRDQIITVLIETARHLGAALVVSTHDQRVATRLRRQWRIRDGRLCTDAGPAPVPTTDRTAGDLTC